MMALDGVYRWWQAERDHGTRLLRRRAQVSFLSLSLPLSLPLSLFLFKEVGDGGDGGSGGDGGDGGDSGDSGGYPSFHYSSSSTLNSEVLSECAPEKMAAPTLSDSTKRILCKWYGFIYFQTGNLAEIKSI
uniref:Uncharacterized protein n=1 Tax=Brassica oleracea var. oleracea TaxID=109376 RepID=A0A0D3DCY3_BRAOL